MREPNAIDFWRGLALITIFINHVPGNVFERFTYSKYSLSDAAELFVFLAGWAHRRWRLTDVAGSILPGRVSAAPRRRGRSRFTARSLVITAIALAMIAAAAIHFDNPLFLEWHNAAPAFSDPLQTTIGWVHADPPARLLQHPAAVCRPARPCRRCSCCSPAISRAGGARLCRWRSILTALVMRAQPADLAGGGDVVLQPAGLAAAARPRLPGLRVVAGLGAVPALGRPAHAGRAGRGRHRGGRRRLRPQAGPASSCPSRACCSSLINQTCRQGDYCTSLPWLLGFQSVYALIAPYIPWAVQRQLSALGPQLAGGFFRGIDPQPGRTTLAL